MFSTAVTYESFTTWATSVGTAVKDTYSSNTLIVDSALGPNDAFGYGATANGSFGGFSEPAVSTRATRSYRANCLIYRLKRPPSKSC